jgi:signal transduction histidine kinase/ligand-binding sensor domain-containing protein/CheY-like chemotaxis protein/HPt (histidine-containing phosphotransfer) domain-containing protein
MMHRHAVTRSMRVGFLWVLSASWGVQAADAPPLVLENLTTAEGLPQGTVNVSLQDSQGFVWLGTEDGLVRYDGHELVRYAYSRTVGGGLPGNFIRDIVEDSHHDLWIGVKDAGLARWNRATDTFTVFRHDPADPASLASDATRVVRLDARGRVWVGTSGAGVDALDPGSGHIEHFRHDPADAGSLGADKVLTLAFDRAGILWVGTAAGLDRWQPGSRSFAHPLTGNQVSQVFEDRSGSLWVGTLTAGMMRLDVDAILRERFRHDPQRADSLSSDEVQAILEDRAGHLWVGTSGGLDLLDRESGGFTHYRHDERDAGSLGDSYVMSLYQDAAGLVWIGTLQGGVSRWNPRSWELGGQRPAWLGGRTVTSFADAPNGKVWIASMGGLVEFDPASGATADIMDRIVGPRDAIGDLRVMALRADRRGSLWIGTMRNGLKKLAPDGHLESIPTQVGDPRSVSADGIMTIFESRNGLLWIGTHDHGANVLDPATGLIRQLPYGRTGVAGAISAGSVTAIAEDLKGNMWLGTEGGGLDLARADGTVTRVFRHDTKDPASISSNTIYAIAVDARGGVWVATEGGGLVHVVGSAESAGGIHFEIFTREQGLSSDTLYGVQSDAAGRIWLSGDAGLMRFDPHTHALKTFHREHGLQGEEFEYNASYRLRDGRLCFGGQGGFNIFDPSRLTDNPNAPRVALTRLEVLGVAVPSATPYWLLDRIGVDYQASIVSLDFGALDFTSPKRNRLAYRVAGLSDRWIDLGTQHRVTLTNLDAGDHLLEVRAANADSVWSDPPLRLTIHRDPAPWRSPWAYAVYGLIPLLLMLYRFRRNRANIRAIIEAKHRLESEVALRTRELVESNRQLAEAARAKSNFLARISHELRTPLNGVVGMTELLGRSTLSSTQSRLTQTIRSSAKLLMHIVNDLLDLSKLQAGKVEFEALPLDLVAILEECTTLFAAAAEAKGVELTVCPPQQELSNLVGDPLRVRQVLMNLVGNAVKFTLQGAVVVKADVDLGASGDADVRITVADTGVGMNAAAIARIFEPFTQADESTTRRFGGSGLGLAICRELAERMGGTVTVESQPDVGSTFCFCVPLKAAGVAAAEGASRTASRVAPFTQRRIRILTRQPPLAESLTRHLSVLGLALSSDECDDPLVIAAGEDLLIADLTTHEAFVDAVLAAQIRAPLVIVGTAAQIDALQRRRGIDPEQLISKPVHRESLLRGLSVAAGVRFKSDESAHAARPNAKTRGHVLLVEDEPVNAAVGHGYLAELGCTCVCVENGVEAVARAATERFDLIMMDLNMPLMDGFAATALIRRREGTNGRVPIVALTAHDAKNHGDACRAADMDDIMSKPYTLEQCARLLDRWLPADPGADLSADVTELTHVDAGAVAAVRSLRGSGHADLYSSLVDLFRAASQGATLELEAAMRRGDLAAAGAVCHKLSASAANVGALAYAREARLLESVCASGESARAQRLADRLLAAHPALIETLSGLQLRASA